MKEKQKSTWWKPTTWFKKDEDEEETSKKDSNFRGRKNTLENDQQKMFKELGYDDEQQQEYIAKEKARIRPTNQKHDPSKRNVEVRGTITDYDKAMSLASKNAYEGHNQEIGERLEKTFEDGSKVVTDFEVVQTSRSVTVYRDPSMIKC